MAASRWIPAFAGMTLVVASAWAQELSEEHQQRYQRMVNELRCLVCQNQSIAESNAPLAADLREQVRRQIEDGKSDEAIRDYVTARYGDFVLYRPPFKPATWALWLGPPVLLLAALALAIGFVRRSRAVPAPTPADPAAIRKLLSEERKP